MLLPILLSSDDESWNLLVEQSGLPSSMFHAGGKHSIPLVIRSDALSLDLDQATDDDLSLLDRLLFACSGGYCVTVIIAKGDEKDDFEKIKEASDRWRKIREQRLRRSEAFLQPILILIGHGLSLRAEISFRNLLNQVADRAPSGKSEAPDRLVFSDYYVMSPRLEKIGNRIFHARHVWPVAVGRLLLLLALTPPSNQGVGIFRAWRFLDLRGTPPDWLFRKILPSCLEELSRRIIACEPADLTLPECRPPTARADFEREQPSYEKSHWFSRRRDEEASKITAEERCEKRLKIASDNEEAKRGDDFKAKVREREEALEHLWSIVSDYTGAAWKACSALAEATKHDIPAMLVESERQLVAVEEARAKCFRSGERLVSGAKELKQAQTHFVQSLYRISICIGVAGLLGAVAFRWGLLFTGNPRDGFLLAAAGVLACFLTTVVSYVVENRAGSRADALWRSRHDDFEKSMVAWNEAFSKARDMAARVAASFDNSTLRSRVTRLLERVKATLPFAMRATSVMHSDYRHDDAVSRGSDDLADYLQLCSLCIGAPRDFSGESEKDLADYTKHSQVVIGLSEQISKKWKKICELTDEYRTGAIRVSELAASLREAINKLPAELDKLFSKSDCVDMADHLVKTLADRASIPVSGLLSIEVSNIYTCNTRLKLALPEELCKELESRDGASSWNLTKLPDEAEGMAIGLLFETVEFSVAKDLVPLTGSHESRST